MAFELLENLSLTDEDTMDVTFKCKNGDSIKANRLALAANNSVFLAMFMNDTTERQNGIINIDDCDAEALKVFLNYLYTGDVKKEDISIDLLQISDRYLDDSLKKRCEIELVQNINDDNVLEKFVAAIAYNCDNLKTSTYFLIQRNLKELEKKTEFDELYKNKEAMRTLLLGLPSITNEANYFQPLKKVSSFFTSLTESSSLQATHDTTILYSTGIPNSFTLYKEDMVCSVKFSKETNAAGITKLFLIIDFLISHFVRCTADIQITLRNVNNPDRSLAKIERNIQVYKETSTKIFIIRHDDLVNLTPIINTNGSHDVNIHFHFAFYDIVRSSTDN